MEKTETQKILEAIQEFSGDVDHKFLGVNSRLDGIDTRLKRVEALMVSKDYLDVKLANQYSDIVNHVRVKVPEWVKIR